jgi:hypothetical protein
MTHPGTPTRICASLAAVFALAACGPGAAPGEPVATGHGVTLRVETPPLPTTGPFVVTAVDNHFHDIHYAERIDIAEDRPFEVVNEGRNLHNFTVVGTDITIDIRPGREFVWPRLGDVLKPGNYQVICTYHADLGMGGHFTVTR